MKLKLIPKTGSKFIFTDLSNKSAIREQLKGSINLVYIWTIGDEEYVGSTSRGFDRLDEYFRLDPKRISNKPRIALESTKFSNVQLTVFEFDNIMGTKLFEQIC